MHKCQYYYNVMILRKRGKGDAYFKKAILNLVNRYTIDIFLLISKVMFQDFD